MSAKNAAGDKASKRKTLYIKSLRYHVQLIFFLTINSILTIVSECDRSTRVVKNKTNYIEKIQAREAEVSQSTKPRVTGIENGGRDSNHLEKFEKEKDTEKG